MTGMRFWTYGNLISDKLNALSANIRIEYKDIFRLCPPPPPQYVMHPPVTEQVSLNGKSLCENMARASGGANIMHPLSWGHKRKRSEYNKKVIRL